MRQFTFLIAMTALAATHARAEKISRLDNGVIQIGVDLDHGGTITLLARSKGGENLINAHDLGRQIQQSYYSGPSPYGKAHPAWKNWPWNPIGTGDVYGHASRVLAHTNDGHSLEVKSIPMQWALDNVPGKCEFETLITLDGPTARVRCRLINHRADTTQYPAHGQELPAVYTIGKLHRLFTYQGDEPFMNQPLTLIKNAGPPWASWTASENWAALVDDQGFGVGVIHPGVYSFWGGFHDKPGQGGPKDNPTGYIAPVRLEILDHNIVYEYDYFLSLGTLEQIRAVATAMRTKDPRPDDHFTHDRRHWTLSGATDGGYPFDGSWKIMLGSGASQLIGPETWWSAATAPRLYVRASLTGRPRTASVSWKGVREKFDAKKRVKLELPADGKFHMIELDLAAQPSYRGTLAGLRLDIDAADHAGDVLRIESISLKSPRPQAKTAVKTGD